MDVLRGFAAAWVVVFHINEGQPWQDTAWRTFCKNGWLGVTVFFVISGYCMARIAAKREGWRSVAAGRLLRIYLPYWGSIAAILGLVLARRLFTGVNDITALPRSPGEIAATFLLATDPATALPTMNAVYWSLTVEVAFYAVVTLAVFFSRPHVVMGVFTLAAAVPAIAGFFLQNLGCFFVVHFPFFALGWALAATVESRANVWLLALALAGVALKISSPQAIAALLTGGLLLLRTVPPRIGDCLKPLTALGAISYSLYLTHFPFGPRLLMGLRPDPLTLGPVANVACDFVALAALIAIAAIFFVFVERPAHRLSQHVARRLSTRRAALSAASLAAANA